MDNTLDPTVVNLDLLIVKSGDIISFMKTHKMRSTRFYSIWTNMRSRCNNVKVRSYSDYGEKGIKVLWRSFEDFRDDMYESYLQHIKEYGEKDTQIERLDTNKSYSKQNCTWATIEEQANNKTTSIKVDGIPLKKIAKDNGIKYSTLYMRLKRKGNIYG